MRAKASEKIEDRISYNPETGVFVWKQTLSGFCRQGKPAGRMGTGRASGYMRITLAGREYKAHRLAWFIMTGEWPNKQIDHINGVPHDNRWSNLRLATQSQNKANGPAYKNSKSGFRGVTWDKRVNRWFAAIQVNGKQKFLGRFVNIADAVDAYQKAAKEHFGGYSRTS